ncbi:MAG: AtpZ/AtpI family protein [Candidatus Paceibacterota bacterium]
MSLPLPPSNTKSSVAKALILGSELGFLIALPLVGCLIFGVFLDKKLDSFPVFILVSVLFGIILTIVSLYKLIIPFLEKGREKNNKDLNKK